MLPGHLKPEHYKISLIPFLIEGNFSVSGSVSITVSCLASGGFNVTLHSLDISVKDFRVTCIETGNEIPVLGTYFDLERQFLVGDLEEELKEGHKYLVHIDFDG